MLTRHAESHVDHVPEDIVTHVLERFKDRDGFFIETFELPANLPALENALYGPACGDPPVREDEVIIGPRPGRHHNSRLVKRPTRQTRTCSVIAGPHDGLPCVLFTVFGGPVSPREVADPTLPAAELEKSQAFWAVHALAN
jgi:hypothetical protein